MARLFISYSRVDRPFVEGLIPFLREVYGYDGVWFDEELHGGQVWWDEILGQIAACEIFVYLLSNEAMGSPYCQAELEEARRLQKQILPVVIRARTTLPDDLSRIQFVDMSAGINERSINKVHAAVNRLSARIPAAPPAPLTDEPVAVPPITLTVTAPPQRRTLPRQWVTVAGVVAALLVIGLLVVNGISKSGQNTPGASATVAATNSAAATETTGVSTSETEIAALPSQNTPAQGITVTNPATETPQATSTTAVQPSTLPTATMTLTDSPEPTWTTTPTLTVSATIAASAEMPPGQTGTISDFQSITSDNASDVVLGYALPGACGPFSPDGSLLVIGRQSVYDVSSGQRRFANDGGSSVFSPDGALLAMSGDGVYDVSSGQRRFANDGGSSVFSPDGALLAMSGDGVYDVSSGQRRFAIGGGSSVFSPDGVLLAMSGDGVYEVSSGQKRFTIGGDYNVAPAFSPDGSLLAVSGDGVYDVSSGQRRFSTGFGAPVFSPDETALAVGDTVYDVSSGQRRFSTGFGAPVFSPDGALLAVGNDAVYDVSTGQRRFVMDSKAPAYYYTPVFSPDGTLLAVAGTVYDVSSGQPRFLISSRFAIFSPNGLFLAVGDNAESCIIYGLASDPWPYRSGLIISHDTVNVREVPAGTPLDTAAGQLAVFARTTDSEWFKVHTSRGSGWVAAQVVIVSYLPDDLPIEDPCCRVSGGG